MRGDKKPLYRKVNRRTHGLPPGHGGKSKWTRNTKAERCSEATRGGMHPGLRHGRDYTPLFRFLLSKVGSDWTEVHREAVARLDSADPIFWMVALTEGERKAVFRSGESSYFSGLYVDENNTLAIVDPGQSIDDMYPSCPCCTHTFNGERFVRTYEEAVARKADR